ncbi:MAG: ATP-binding protein [Verrucomicrobiota bacterium]
MLTVVGWSGSYFLWQIANREAVAYFYSQVLTVFSLLASVTFYHFVLDLSEIQSKRFLSIAYVSAVILIFLTSAGYIVGGVSEKLGHRFWPNAGELMWFYLLHFTACLAASGWVLITGWRTHLGSKASDFLFVFVSGLIGFVGASTNFPLWFDIPIQPYANILVAVYVLILGYGLYSNKIGGIGLDIYKAFLGLFLNISVAIFYLLCVAFYGVLFDVEFEAAEFWKQGILVFMISALAFWGAPKLKYRAERVLDGVFRQEWSTALSTLSTLPTKISELGDADAIAELTCETINRSLEVEYVSMFTLKRFQSAYHCIYTAGSGPCKLSNYDLNAENPIIQLLSEKPGCVVLDQIYGETEKLIYRALVEVKRALNVSIIVPIFAHHDVHGLIFIGQPKSARVVAEEEVSILFGIGAQIGINQRTRDFERRTNEMDKLVALGTMAAGLAHEIRNPLVSVQTLASVLKNGKSVNAIPEDFRNVLLRDIKRIASIVEGVALYSYSQEARKVAIKIEEIIRASIEIHEKEAATKGVTLKYDAANCEEILVRGNFEQLGQVFNNLIENALYAVADIESPMITVSIKQRVVRRLESQSWVEVSVKDNGPGVAKGIIDRIFDPFITSKDTGTREEKKGMGLGLAICKRIIENHEGAISVQNNSDSGAKFIVSLKCINLIGANA